jgi:hypothetical protein
MEKTGARCRVDSSQREIANDAIALRRKVVFWRRVVWMILGAAAILLTVVWNRYETRRRECRDTLLYNAELAKKVDLAHEHVSILEQQWQMFDIPSKGSSPRHYDLIARNWAVIPAAGEKVPLAVCADAHLDLFTRGRHVLFNTLEGMRVDWLSDEEAQSIVEMARKDNPHK